MVMVMVMVMPMVIAAGAGEIVSSWRFLGKITKKKLTELVRQWTEEIDFFHIKFEGC